MADVRDWGAFIRGRWNWKRFGYEKDFPRTCGFTDVDAAVEFDGKALLIETKHYDGIGALPGLPSNGQLWFLQDEVKRGKYVLVLYGCGVCDDPYAVYDVGGKQWFKFLDGDGKWQDKEERRRQLKRHINFALGLPVDTSSREAS